jgi:hypothetical protein
MVIEKLCPVCGYEMEEGPRNFNICPSCGTEFGLHDLNSSINDLREAWVANGAHWHSHVIAAPTDWKPLEQLLRTYLSAQTWMRTDEAAVMYESAFPMQSLGDALPSQRKKKTRTAVPQRVDAASTSPLTPRLHPELQAA